MLYNYRDINIMIPYLCECVPWYFALCDMLATHHYTPRHTTLAHDVMLRIKRIFKLVEWDTRRTQPDLIGSDRR